MIDVRAWKQTVDAPTPGVPNSDERTGSVEKEDLGWRVLGGAAALASGMLARKVLTFAWTKATGKEPPDDPDSLDVRLAEALAWAVVTGVGTGVARVLVTRAVARGWQRAGRLPSATGEEPPSR
jgi:hypothetical protein